MTDTHNVLAIKIMGEDEPVYQGPVTDHELTHALNWYKQMCESKDAKKYLLRYLKERKVEESLYKAVDRVNDQHLDATLCFLSRMVMNGSILNPNHLKRFEEKLTSLFIQVKKNREPVEVVEEVKPKVNLQERTEKFILQVCGEIDTHIDKIITSSDYQETVDVRGIFTTLNVKNTHGKRIAEIYKKERDECIEAITKWDDMSDDNQISEAYRKYGKIGLKRIIGFYDSIINGSLKHTEVAGNTRKPRKKKEKPPTILTQKFKPLMEYAGVKGIEPKDVIGKSIIYIYNVKYKKFGVIVADDNTGITAKEYSSTLYNVSTHKSVGKTLRKPEEFIKNAAGATSVSLKRMFDDLTTKASTQSPRINEDTIIIKAF